MTSSEGQQTLLEVSDLQTSIFTKRRTIRAIDRISLEVRPGETVGLVGESGSGKSMTGLSIMRLLPPGGRIVGGSVRLGGRELVSLPESEIRRIRGNEVAMVYQNPMTSLNPTKTIGEQIAEALRTHLGMSRRESLERTLEVLDQVGMPQARERLDAYPHQLSGGLRQRVIIAMALACKPKLLIADEPTTALDVTIQDQILALLDRLKDELHMGMLLITHDMGVIAERADRMLVMYAGRLVEVGETPALFRNMRHPYTQALLESIPDLQVARTDVLYSIPGLPPDLSQPSYNCSFAPRCRYAQLLCKQSQPEPKGGGSHKFSCFFPVDGPRRTPPDAPSAAATVNNAAADGGKREASTLHAVAAANKPDHATDKNQALLVFDRVVKEFPLGQRLFSSNGGSIKAVSDVSLQIEPGETFGLVGESGCGKSTLARLIVGLDKYDTGSIRFNGAEVGKLKRGELRDFFGRVQLVFQDPYSSLDPRMRVSRILEEPFVAQGIGTRRGRRAQIEQLLDEVGLPKNAAERFPHEFSGGQRQRIGFARAMAVSPQLIVADEPVSALDVSIQSQILNLMKRLQRDRGLTYIVISHDLSVIRYLADRIGVMYLGKLVELGEADDIYAHPAHPYTAGLLAAIPVPDPEARPDKRAPAIRGELPSAANPPSGCRFRTRCPRAAAVCAKQVPPLQRLPGGKQHVACHFPLHGGAIAGAA